MGGVLVPTRLFRTPNKVQQGAQGAVAHGELRGAEGVGDVLSDTSSIHAGR